MPDDIDPKWLVYMKDVSYFRIFISEALLDFCHKLDSLVGL